MTVATGSVETGFTWWKERAEKVFRFFPLAAFQFKHSPATRSASRRCAHWSPLSTLLSLFFATNKIDEITQNEPNRY